MKSSSSDSIFPVESIEDPDGNTNLPASKSTLLGLRNVSFVASKVRNNGSMFLESRVKSIRVVKMSRVIRGGGKVHHFQKSQRTQTKSAIRLAGRANLENLFRMPGRVHLAVSG